MGAHVRIFKSNDVAKNVIRNWKLLLTTPLLERSNKQRQGARTETRIDIEKVREG